MSQQLTWDILHDPNLDKVKEHTRATIGLNNIVSTLSGGTSAR